MSLIEIIKKTVDVLKKQPVNGYEEMYVGDCSVLLAEIERLTKENKEFRSTARFREIEDENKRLKEERDLHKEAHGVVLEANSQLAVDYKWLTKENQELKEEIDHPERTYCAWCGFTVEIDDEGCTNIAKHVNICDKHPLNKKIADHLADIERLKEAYIEQGGKADKALAENAKLKEELKAAEQRSIDWAKIAADEVHTAVRQTKVKMIKSLLDRFGESVPRELVEAIKEALK